LLNLLIVVIHIVHEADDTCQDALEAVVVELEDLSVLKVVIVVHVMLQLLLVVKELGELVFTRHADDRVGQPVHELVCVFEEVQSVCVLIDLAVDENVDAWDLIDGYPRFRQKLVALGNVDSEDLWTDTFVLDVLHGNLVLEERQ
jgi:hypothetical protein